MAKVFPINHKNYKGSIHFGIIESIAADNVVTSDVGSVTSPRIDSPDWKDKVILYLPQNLPWSTDAVQYGETDLGTIGAFVEKGLKDGLSSSIDAIKANAGAAQAKLFGMNVAQQFGDALGGAVKSATGLAINPNTRTLFDKVGIRTFNFSFKMIPENKQESANIKEIVKHFREQMYPVEEPFDATNQGLIATGYKFPNRFRIQAYFDGKPIAFKILPCYLKTVSVVYNASSMGFHEGGEWSEVDLTLEFMEERALNKHDIDRGF